MNRLLLIFFRENTWGNFLVKEASDLISVEEIFKLNKMPSFSNENSLDIDEIIENGGKAKNTVTRERQVIKSFQEFIEQVFFFFSFSLSIFSGIRIL